MSLSRGVAASQIVVPLAALVAALALAVPFSAAAQTAPMRAHFIDVGQGDATLLEFPCAAVLIDTGGELYGGFDGRRELMAYLDAFFARRTDLGRTLAAVFLTHPHIDHTLGVRALIDDGITIERAVTNGQVPPLARRRDLDKGRRGQLDLVDHVPDMWRREVTFPTVADVAPVTDALIDPVDCSGAGGSGVDPRIRVLWGQIGQDPGWGYETHDRRREDRHDDENNHSLVIRVDYGDASLLLTGDLEQVAIADLLAAYAGGDLLDVDVYQVGHHGSHNGTTQDLLDAMTPKVAVVSMGPAGRKCSWRHPGGCYTAYQHGHPRRNIVQELDRSVALRRPQPVTVPVARGQRDFVPEEVERCVYGTGWSGTVVLTADAAGWIAVEEPAAEPCGGATPP